MLVTVALPFLTGVSSWLSCNPSKSTHVTSATGDEFREGDLVYQIDGDAASEYEDGDTGNADEAPVDLCGNSVIDSNEACDDGELNGTYGHCRNDCFGVGSHCGDGSVDSENEDCDRGELYREKCPCDSANCVACGLDCQWSEGPFSRSCAGEINPWVQLVLPQSAWILWESTDRSAVAVQWGADTDLSQSADADGTLSGLTTSVFAVQLTELAPATRYYYRVPGAPVLDFVTPAHPEDEVPLRFAVMSDTQRHELWPNKHWEIIHQGVLSFMETERRPELPAALTAVLIPGDLVDNGLTMSQWQDQFLEPAADLMAHVPYLPAWGNHDRVTPATALYFRLPGNSDSSICRGRIYHQDFSNVRIIALDEFNPVCIAEEVLWLPGVLEDAADNEMIDFVFVQIHTTTKSEMWTVGENPELGFVVNMLEEFTRTSGKPAMQLYGHTHGYSRGQSRDARFLWVQVATAGGSLDRWGQEPTNDYAEFSVSTDDWGFVWIETWAGDDPRFRLRRISRGDDSQTLNNVILDDLVIHRYALPPTTPQPLAPTNVVVLSGSEITLQASAYSDTDGENHGASHWQVSQDCPSFASILREHWRQNENWYFDVDTQADDDLCDELFTELPRGTPLCWRVRYRDVGLLWSEWSNVATFSLTP
ncbi:MAG: hypothetical protein A2289_14750 [Deltaproteobacteria bacterium RIFOXYA12_FULL_58_15]|nr:MAG: hypothetical protein A2289_14750 [Deltaproteobacteria bacterium RIFOXYA12_FULL_58_15]OGR07842.1 MAG: hypothetical protein A2341_07190 [Deltaproteobacteria bacterium RIFOXYB12_FULL_58_9]